MIASRMAKAADEMSHWAEYDYVIINNDIDQAFAEVRAILAAERLKRERQTGLSDFRPRSAGTSSSLLGRRSARAAGPKRGPA